MNTMDPNARFLWLDLETTGLDPEKDSILEIAYWPSRSADPFDLDEGDQRTFVIKDTPAHLAEKLSPFTWRMHGASGLLADVVESQVAWWQPNDALCSLLEDKAITWHLAGNSVHFDRSFINNNFGKVAERLSHRILDVSSVKMVARAMGMPHNKGEPAHRALDDVKSSVSELRACVEFFQRQRIQQCLNQCPDEDRCLRPAGHSGRCTSRGGEGYGWSPRCDSPADFPCACGATHVVNG